KIVSVTKIPQGFSFVVNGVQFNMLLVEGSTFWMGANDGSEGINNSKIDSNVRNYDSEAEDDEKPVHSVTLSSFYMGETEVTQALWMAVMGVEPAFDGGWTDEEGRGSNYPAYNVSWNDIQDFILKLNNLTGRHFRLPMEAEWEYAARGGKKSSGFKYAGSNNLGRVAWYDVNSVNMAHVVKTKLPNELGLYDMSGNLWEWCGDWYGDYTIVSQVDPRGASDGSVRVLRGGSWDCDAEECRVSYRNYDAPDLREYSNGFRLALSM
ncbi:MAG: formylglycine-generating enzyme family protein, partial [Prevotella sp.]|nr:formylglycine-generating enzyme family protein [Prevotella sp.]